MLRKSICIALVESGNIGLLESVNDCLGLLASFCIVCQTFTVIINQATLRCEFLAFIVVNVQLRAMDCQILLKGAIAALLVIIVIKVEL